MKALSWIRRKSDALPADEGSKLMGDMADWNPKNVHTSDYSSTSATISDQALSASTGLVHGSDSLHEPKRHGTFVGARSASRKQFLSSCEDFTLNKLNTSELAVYGRETEIRRLEIPIEKLTTSSKRDQALIVVKGYAGTGKSVLVKQLHTFAQTRGVLFSIGKFDMKTNAAPYSAFRTAFASAIEYLLDQRSENELTRIREKINEELGRDWKILTDVVPNLHLLLGEMLEEAGEGRGETNGSTLENIEGRPGALRLRFYFQTFLDCLCSEGIPLVIVLDDVQWVDASSIELIDAFLSDAIAPPAMLIVTYRDNEVDPDHPFAKLLEQIKQKGIPLVDIELRGLDIAACNSMLSTLLRIEDSLETKGLAEVIKAKTGGNPFFILQFLQLLIDEELLAYNFGTLRWHWRVEEIQNMMVTDNVVAFLTARIAKLDRDVQEVLQVASFLGRCFERDDLLEIADFLMSSSIVLHESNEGFALLESVVENLVQSGLIEKIGSMLMFAHDQIQAAASQIMSEEARTIVRYHVTKFLLNKHRKSQLNEHDLFLVASLSDSGIDLARDADEQQMLAHINLMASQAAMRKSAFDAALKFAESGLQFLGAARWDSSYSLSIRLTSIAVESAYCTGDFGKMDLYVQEVLLRGGRIDDKMRAYRTRLESYSVQERFKEGIREGLLVLRELGFRAPRRGVSFLSVIRDLLWTKVVMKKHTLNSLISLPLMSEKNRSWAMGVIENLSVMTYFAEKNLFIILWLHAVVWSSKYGVNEYTLVAFCIWGSICHTVFGDIDKSVMFADAVLHLSEKVENKSTFPRVIYITYGFIYHWQRDMRASVQPSWMGYIKGMEVGSVEVAMYNLCFHDFLQYATCSLPLKSLLVDGNAHVKIMRDYHQDATKNYCLCIVQVIQKLVGLDDNPQTISGHVMVEDDMITIAKETGNEVLEAWVAVFAKELAYLFGFYDIAGNYSDKAKKYGIKIHDGYTTVPRHFFIDALIAIALCRNGKERRKNWGKAKKILKTMKKWQSIGNPNVVHMTSLIDAELTAVKGDKASAATFYKNSIRVATRNGFLNDAALAHERAADYFLSFDDFYWASHHIREAVQRYEEWQAVAKVEQLRTKFQLLLGSSEVTRDTST